MKLLAIVFIIVLGAILVTIFVNNKPHKNLIEIRDELLPERAGSGGNSTGTTTEG